MFRFLIYSLAAIGCFVVAIVLTIAGVLLSTPNPENIRGCITAEMYKVPLCPTNKNYTRLNEISPFIRAAVVVSEDGAFFQHNGLDFHELQLTFQENWKEGRIVRGGSTITQQLAKNVYLSGEKSLFRKAREALIAIQLEKILNKNEILEKYLNVVEFGPNIYGVRQATQFYFGKPPGSVTVLEAAWLAFVLPNPKTYSTSFRRRELTRYASKQLKVIIERMGKFKKVPEEQAQEALDQLASMFKPEPDPNFDEQVTQEEENLLNDGLGAGDNNPLPLPPPRETLVKPVAPEIQDELNNLPGSESLTPEFDNQDSTDDEDSSDSSAASGEPSY